MKFIIIFFLLLPCTVFSQIQGEDEVYLNGERIDAKFNGGGIDEFGKFLRKEFDYSKVTRAGKLEAAFTIDEQGNLTKIRITQVLDVESASEFIRVLKNSPKWQPAQRNGKSISVEIKYPMVFYDKERKQSENKYDEQKPHSDSVSEKVYEISAVEAKPYFNGGLKKFYEYVASNFRVPEVEGLKGKVLVSFVVEKDGSLTDIQVLKHIGYGTKEEVIKVLRKCPKWNPATQNGIPIRCVYSLPISIQSY